MSVLKSEGHTAGLLIPSYFIFTPLNGWSFTPLIKGGLFIELRWGLYCISCHQSPVLPICLLKSLYICCKRCSLLNFHLLVQHHMWKVIKQSSASYAFFKLIFNFNWRLITLQYCGGFCHTLT